MSTITELEEKVTELLDEIETLKRKKKFELEYPFEIGKECWFISSAGSLFRDSWDTALISCDRYSQGNVFKTRKEAERERDRRALLTRFRQFRDKCNGDWKPDFDNFGEGKYYILFTHRKEFHAEWTGCSNHFSQFGYFKNEKDCERAIELFGDEIKQLFLEEK